MIHSRFAAKVAAAHAFAAKDQLAAMLDALKSEEQAELSVLKQREHGERQSKRLKRFAWKLAVRAVTHPKKSSDPNRPRPQRSRRRRRDRQHG